MDYGERIVSNGSLSRRLSFAFSLPFAKGSSEGMRLLFASAVGPLLMRRTRRGRRKYMLRAMLHLTFPTRRSERLHSAQVHAGE